MDFEFIIFIFQGHQKSKIDTQWLTVLVVAKESTNLQEN